MVPPRGGWPILGGIGNTEPCTTTSCSSPALRIGTSHAQVLRLRGADMRLAAFVAAIIVLPSPSFHKVGRMGDFGALWLACVFPCRTLHVQPRGCPRMTWGRDGAATPFTWGSFIPYSNAGLSRRFQNVPSLPPDRRFRTWFCCAFAENHGTIKLSSLISWASTGLPVMSGTTLYFSMYRWQVKKNIPAHPHITAG